MPDTKIADLTTATPATADLIPFVDVSDTTDSAAGSSRKTTVAALLALSSVPVTVVHADGSETVHEPAGDTDAARGTAFLAALAAAASGETVRLGPYTFALGEAVANVPDGVSVVGSGITETVITSEAELTTTPGLGCIVRPGSNSVVSDLTIHGTLTNGTPQACLGFIRITSLFGAESGQAGFTDAVARRVRMVADTDGVYTNHSLASPGTPAACSLRCFDCEVTAKYDSVMNSWGASVVELYDCHLVSVGPSALDAGATAAGIAARGGPTGTPVTRAYGGSISVSGATTNNTAVEVSQTDAVVELYGVSLRSAGAGALDVWQTFGAVRLHAADYDPAKVTGTILPVLAPLHVLTAAPGTDTTQAASTAFVEAAVAAGGGGADWGDIGGTLADQTDLQAALDLKAPLLSPTFGGTVTFGSGGTRHANNTFAAWANAEANAWRFMVGLDNANTGWLGTPFHLVQLHTGSRVEFLLAGATVMASVRSQGGAGVLELPQVTAGGTPSTNTFRLYGLDVAGTCEGYAADEAGNETQLTGHAFDGPASLYDAADWPHVVKEMNVYLGVVRYLNVSRTCRALEMLLKAIRAGQTLADIRANLQARPLSDFDLFHQESFAAHNARPGASGTLTQRTWAADQAERQARYDADRADAMTRHAGWEALPENVRASIPEPVVPPAADVRKPKPAWLADRGA